MADPTNTPTSDGQPAKLGPKFEVFSLLLRSRKAIIFTLVLSLIGIAGLGFILIVLRSAWRGEMPIKDAMQMVFGVVIGGIISAAGAGWKLMGAIADEDVAKVNATAPKAPTVQVAAGEGAVASTNNQPAAVSPTATEPVEPK